MNYQIVFIVAAVALVAMNCLSFGLMAYDKRCARRRRRRVPESTLFLVTACFGGVGGVLAMKLLHHKTLHWDFKVFFPMMMTVQLALLAYAAYRLFL